MRLWQSSRTAIVGAAIVVFFVCCVLPIAYLLASSLTQIDSYSTLILDARQRQLLFNTGLIGIGTALLATLIGAPLGISLARIPFAHKAALRLALVAPVLLPPSVVGLAWTYVGSRHGLVASFVGPDLLSDWTYSLTGAVVVLGLVLYPVSMIATEVTIRRTDGRLEEAALLAASPGRVLWRITLPLAAPVIAAAALVILVLAVSEFGVPGLLRVRVYTTEVFTAFAARYDFGRAILLALPLLLLCVVIAGIAGALVGERLITTRRYTMVRSTMLERWHRPAIVAVFIVLAVALILPLGILMREAVGVRSVLGVFAGSGQAVANSLVFAAVGATVVVGVAFVLGHTRARASARVGYLADIMLIALFAVPSTIVGVGLIGLWNRPGWVGAMYGTDLMLVLGYLARFVPVAALALGASSRSVPESHEEAAAVCGAGWLRTMLRIVLPQLRLGLLAAWVIIFVLAFGELGVSILVAPPGEATLPIRIYTLIANTSSAEIAALALLQALVILLPLAGLGAVFSVREER